MYFCYDVSTSYEAVALSQIYIELPRRYLGGLCIVLVVASSVFEINTGALSYSGASLPMVLHLDFVGIHDDCRKRPQTFGAGIT